MRASRATFTIFQAALQQFGKQIVEQMRTVLKRNNNDNTGRLSNSIEATIDKENLDITMLGYGKFVNDGAERRAGKLPPIIAINAWINKNGITPRGKVTARQLPYVIQASIGKRGQTQRKAFPFIEPAIEGTLKTDLNLFGEAIEKQIDLIFTELKK
jgi:hypothetical protein